MTEKSSRSGIGTLGFGNQFCHLLNAVSSPENGSKEIWLERYVMTKIK